MKRFFLPIIVLSIGIVGCSKDADVSDPAMGNPTANVEGGTPGAPAASGGTPTATQGGHFSNPNADTVQAGSKLGGGG